ncbi:MAG: pullulanase-associated domain-containing protein, partial [Bacillota bacterium]
MFKKKFLIAMMLFLTFFTVACSTDNDTKDDDIIDDDNDNNQEEPYEGALLYVHYYRFDGEYDDWSLWLWPNEPESLDGAQYFFEETDDFGVVAEIPIEGNDFEDSTEAGIIVRGVDDWTKDIDADRFIDMSQKDDDGNLHIYLVENTVDIYYSEDDVDAGDRIMQSQFTSDDTIEFRTTSPVDEADISILKDDNPVTIDAFDMTENNGTITLSETVDLNSTYHITIDFGNDVVRTSMVRFDGFYDSQAFEDAYYYDGELGAIHSTDSTTFRLWAPISEAVTLNLYTHGHESSQLDYDDNAGVDTPYEEIDLTRIEKGVWEATVDGDLHGVYYTFTVTNDDISNEVVDPYAYSTGVNGERGMVVDFDQTNPDNWEVDERPPTITNFTDAIIYEIHVRDYTTHDSWNGADDYRGKF